MNIKAAVIFALLTILFTAGIIFLVARDEQMSLERPYYDPSSYRRVSPARPAPEPISEEEFEKARKSLPKTDKIDFDIK
ncbi:MAG: hypothetical protein HQL30_10060 [Candidatus Omnitrophica bacterium]|nr:hypothetical protein [Candidatus Omnitrophota bacterium]